MIGVCEVSGPVLGYEVHEEKSLADEEDDGKNEEDGLPDRRGEREAGVCSLAVIPKLGPAVEGDKTPEGIEEGEDHEADRFASVQRCSEHVHHVPSTMEIRQTEADPVGNRHPA